MYNNGGNTTGGGGQLPAAPRLFNGAPSNSTMPHGPQVGAYMQGGVAMIGAQSPPTRIGPQGVVTNEQRRIINVREQRIGMGYGGAPYGMQARGVMGPGDPFYGAPGAAFHNGMQVQQMVPMVGMEQRGIAPPSDDVRVSTALLSSLIPSLPPSPSPSPYPSPRSGASRSTRFQSRTPHLTVILSSLTQGVASWCPSQGFHHSVVVVLIASRGGGFGHPTELLGVHASGPSITTRWACWLRPAP